MGVGATGNVGSAHFERTASHTPIVFPSKQCLHRTGTSISFVDAFRISSRILKQVDLGKRFGLISNSRSELVNPVDVFSTPV